MGLFGKFELPLWFFKKTKLLNEGIINPIPTTEEKYTKTIAVFELDITEPRFNGDIPEAKIKFYPFDQ